MKIPSMLLKRMYTYGSLINLEGSGALFNVKNRLSDATIKQVTKVAIDDQEYDLNNIKLHLRAEGRTIDATDVSPDNPLDFPLRSLLDIEIPNIVLDKGHHHVEIAFDSSFGKLAFKVKDSLSEGKDDRVRVPCDKIDNYKDSIIQERIKFAEEWSGTKFEHINKWSFDPQTTQGNVENFTGVAQIPIGLAGPINIDGEHAKGEFIIPLATTEGTLVASYNRGIKVLNLSGGVKTTVQADCMQRAPVFIFESAREARDFKDWVIEHTDKIAEEAEATSSVAKLEYIDTYLSNKFAYLRFNYFTGDAAGQNMVGRATFAACSWILDHNKTIKRFYLESNLATDKKHSQINIMRTRGKRVTAECVIPHDILVEHMRVEPESLHYHSNVSNIGAMLSGANNNGAHSPNGITAMFIATGQDVANVSESCAGILYSEITPKGDLYISLTIPSLIVATFGGGTSLPTQRECLDMLGCRGRNTVKKFAEIVAGVALAGEISLGSAISSLDWVSSHEKYGRNR